MAKISISLPDPLKEQLDRYAQEHELSVSETVQKALEALLQPPAPAEPPTVPPPSPGASGPSQDGERVLLENLVFTLNRELQETRRYLLAVAHQGELHRQCLVLLAPYAAMGGVCLPVPPPLPPPE